MRFLSVFALLTVLSRVSAQSAPDVKLPSGIAKGFQKESDETGVPYNVYYGIPFAEPPVGKLRFMAPEPYKGSPDSVLTADDFRASCINGNPAEVLVVSEDCLFLNIYTPADASPKNVKKVVVYVHGGAFIGGSTTFMLPTEWVASRDIIVVTIQYRLSGFGFLSSGDRAMPGNQGLRDILLALNWVKDNIAQFGGDADDVTLDGNSAGAIATSAVSITRQARGLFTKAIMQSGTVLSSIAVEMNPEDTFRKFAENAGCLPTARSRWGFSQRVVNCLQQLTAEQIQLAHPFVMPTFDESMGDMLLFKITGTDRELFPKPPKYLLRDRYYLRQYGVTSRKYINGLVDNEGLLAALFLSATGKDPRTELVKPEVVKGLVRSIAQKHIGVNPPEGAQATSKFISAYTGEEEDQMHVQAILDLHDDDMFAMPAIAFTQFLITADPSTEVYMFLFDAEAIPFDPVNGYKGTCHTMDLVHQFDETPTISGVFFYAAKDPAKFPIIREHFRDYLTDFVKTGDPVSSDPAVSWPPYDLENQQYMFISSEPEVRKDLYTRRAELWQQYFSQITVNNPALPPIRPPVRPMPRPFNRPGPGGRPSPGRRPGGRGPSRGGRGRRQ